MLKLPTVLVNGGFRSTTGYSGFADAVISVFIFLLSCSSSGHLPAADTPVEFYDRKMQSSVSVFVPLC